jgi:prephenate dehydratase
MRVAHLGPPGTFGESAAFVWHPRAEYMALPSHVAVVEAVDRGGADVGVLAIENSIEGSVNETLDLLIHDTELSLVGEVVVPVEHCLLASPETPREAIRVVYSHPQALAQCRKYLARELPAARQEVTLSTVLGVERAMEEPDAAAIGSERAAHRLSAAVLDRSIQDRSGSVTRFVIVGRDVPEPTGRDKTSLAFKTAHDRPGTLVEVLGELASRGVNLTKIESRPSRDALGVYVFLIDLEGHARDPRVAEALDGVRSRASWLRVFGSYRRA